MNDEWKNNSWVIGVLGLGLGLVVGAVLQVFFLMCCSKDHANFVPVADANDDDTEAPLPRRGSDEDMEESNSFSDENTTRRPQFGTTDSNYSEWTTQTGNSIQTGSTMHTGKSIDKTAMARVRRRCPKYRNKRTRIGGTGAVCLVSSLPKPD